MSADICPPWCTTDHKDVSDRGHVSLNHHGEHRGHYEEVDGARKYVNVHAFQAPGPRWGAQAPKQPEVVVNTREACLMLPVKEAPGLADLLGELGHAELADMVREVAAEVLGEVTS